MSELERSIKGSSNRALEVATDIPHVTRQDIVWDPRPNEWRRQASEALDSEMAKPAPNPYALDKVQSNA